MKALHFPVCILLRNKKKIKLDFRYKFRLIHHQILGAITHIEPKI